MNLHQLELFCAVADAGSFARASRELFISQPALSVQIKRLESSLGVDLLRRSRTGVTLTGAGADLYSAAQGVLQQVQAAERRLQSLRDGEAGLLNVGVDHSGALYFAASMVKEFRKRYPAIRVNVQVQDLRRSLEQVSVGTLDAEVSWEQELLPADLETIFLREVDFGIVCAPEHPCARAGRMTAQEFAQTPFISMNPGLALLSIEEMWMLEHHVVPTTVSHQSSIDAAKRLVEANLGIAILSRLAVERELKAGTLVWLRMEGFALRRQLLLVTNRRAQPPIVQQLVAFAREFSDAYQGA